VLTNRDPGGLAKWWHSDSAFTLDSSVPASTIVAPADGESAFDSALPFEWSEVPLARGYRLKIGTTPGGNDVHDSGEIHVTRRFVHGLPLGTLFGRVETKISGQWQASDFVFTVVANTSSTAIQIQNALWATGVVRHMALADNRAFNWTELADVVHRGSNTALCSDFAEALLRVLGQMNVQLPAQRLDVAFNPNNYDAHTLVELFNPDTNSWLLLDPTFGLTVRRTADGGFATAEELSAATAAQQWSDMTYEFLTAEGDSYARGYYIDYPLLFVNVYHQGHPPVNGVGGPVLPYLEPVTLPISGEHLAWAVGCTGSQTTYLWVNGVNTTIACNGVDGVSVMFGASQLSITSQTAPSTTVYRPKRFVF
jgi:hypothetical protein